MRDLSLHVLDIAQNSIAAGASHIGITLAEHDGDILDVQITDNGCGMTEDQLKLVTDPFYTTRTTRRIGMGLSLFRMAAEMTGGSFSVSSAPGEGTVVAARFVRNHIDCLPVGDMADTAVTLIRLNPHLDFCFRYTTDSGEFTADTREFREILGDVPLNTPEVAQWIYAFIEEHMQTITSPHKAANP